MDEGTRIFFLGDMLGSDNFDMVMASLTQFQYKDSLDEFTHMEV